MKTQLKMIRGDITTVEAEAIVNSANNDLLLGGGVSGAIRRVAGPAVQEECHKIGTIPLGTAVVTTGGQLKAQWIIHAAVNPLGLWADAKSVRNATRSALKKAEDKKVRRLAFPAIGTGAGALPVERCADILIEEVTRHCANDQTSLEEVMFVLYDEKPFAIFEERFKQKVLGEPPTPEGAPPGKIPQESPPPSPQISPPPAAASPTSGTPGASSPAPTVNSSDGKSTESPPIPPPPSLAPPGSGPTGDSSSAKPSEDTSESKPPITETGRP